VHIPHCVNGILNLEKEEELDKEVHECSEEI
jgi:hypothetical protein